MLKENFPSYIDDVEIPWSSDWNESYETKETVNETEAGTDQVIVQRFNKLTISASHKCLDEWASKFIEFSKKDFLSIKIYDIMTKGYVTHNMRMRNFKCTRVKKSEDVAISNGVWQVSFDLIEF